MEEKFRMLLVEKKPLPVIPFAAGLSYVICVIPPNYCTAENFQRKVHRRERTFSTKRKT